MIQNDYRENLIYYERQHFAPWVYIVLAAVAAIGAAPWLTDLGWTQDKRAAVNLVIALSVASALPLCLNVLRMHIEITKDTLYIHFGYLFPMLWKRIPLGDIVETRSVVYRPLRDAGGWGWRYGRFEGNSGWFFNAKGNKGVLILTRDNRQYIVGSQQPDTLKAAIENACEKNRM